MLGGEFADVLRCIRCGACMSYCRLPFATGWTRHRDFPAPQGATFQAQWRRR